MMHVKCIVSNLFLLESLIEMGKICVSVFKLSFFLKPLIDRNVECSDAMPTFGTLHKHGGELLESIGEIPSQTESS